MKTGRKRKAGTRHPCGKLKQPTAEQRAAALRSAEEAEMRVVLAQPHRRGNRSQLAESPLGRFCLVHDLPGELFDAGEEYASLKRAWNAHWSGPMPDRLGGNGGDIDMETLDRWLELIKAWEGAMLDAGGYHGRLTVIALAFDRTEGVRIYPQEAKAALLALAKFQGRLGRQT